MNELLVKKLSILCVVPILLVAMACVVLCDPKIAFAQDGTLAASTIAIAAATDQVQAVKDSAYTTVKKVKLSKTKATIKNNGKLKLKAKLVPKVKGKKIKDKKVTWTVSNSKIARITQNGVVQGKKAGTVTVTARAANGKKAKATIKVVIQKSKMARAIPVLTYHRITTNAAKKSIYSDKDLAVSASLFKRQMKWLKDNGYHTISTSEMRDWLVDGAFLPKKSVLLTIDDGFYETYYVAYPILKKYGLKATSFIVGINTGETTDRFDPKSTQDHFLGMDIIAKLRKEYPKLEFQSHTYDMHHYGKPGVGRAVTWSRKQIDADFKANEMFGFTAIAYPYGHAPKKLRDAARATKRIGVGFGYRMYYPATRHSDPYKIPRYKVCGDEGMGPFKRMLRDAR